MTEIFHVIPKPAWDQARLRGEYRGDTLDTEGFIHCCTAAQVAGVLDRYFRGQAGLLLLKIDLPRLRPPVRWESPPHSLESFPHVYGPLNLNAVVDITPLDIVEGADDV